MSASDTTGIEIYLNDSLIKKDSAPTSRQYDYSTTITNPLETQNKLTVKTVGAQGVIDTKDLIIFRR